VLNLFIYCGKRGERNNSNLTPDEARGVLKSYESISLDGSMINTNSIDNDLKKYLSKSLHQSGRYKMLKRNGWKKILPRPQNPNHAQEAIDDFKKNFFLLIKRANIAAKQKNLKLFNVS
jgi:hypothetical protein